MNEYLLVRNNIKFAHISAKYQKQGIEWLRLSPGLPNENSVSILLYKELSKPCLYDYWFENLDVAIKWAEKSYGVKSGDWILVDRLIERGILDSTHKCNRLLKEYNKRYSKIKTFPGKMIKSINNPKHI